MSNQMQDALTDARRIGSSLGRRRVAQIVATVVIPLLVASIVAWGVRHSWNLDEARSLWALWEVLAGTVALLVLGGVIAGLVIGPQVRVTRLTGGLDDDNAESRRRNEEVINDTRRTYFEILGAIALAVGVLVTWMQFNATQKSVQETLRQAREGQDADRYAQAMEQLQGSEDSTRLGGVYSLQELLRSDIKRYYRPVMATLSAYVREEARQPQKSSVDAALVVLIGSWDHDEQDADFRLNLAGADLRGAQIPRAHLEGAILDNAQLDNVNLSGAHLGPRGGTSATLSGTSLNGTIFSGADLESAIAWPSSVNAATTFAGACVKDFRLTLRPPSAAQAASGAARPMSKGGLLENTVVEGPPCKPPSTPMPRG